MIAEPPPDPVFDPDVQELVDRALEVEPIKVKTALRDPHPLVAATRDRLRRLQRPFHLRSAEERDDKRPTLEVCVSVSAMTRALCIMDALIKRVEEIGGTVDVGKDRWYPHRTQPVICFAGEPVQGLRLREKDRQVPVPPEKRKGWGSAWDLEPTGLLILDGGPSSIDRALLRDTPRRRRIEDGLDEFVIGLVKRAGHARIRRRREDEEQKRREEEAKLRWQREEELRKKREDLQRRQAKEQARVDRLVAEVAAWNQSRQIRAYLEAVVCMLKERGGGVAETGEVAEYLKWARDQADRLDPLVKSPPSVLDEKI